MKPDNNILNLNKNSQIAIIGMGCFFPKASGLKEYWRLLSKAQDAIGDIPETHWSPEDYYDKDPKKPDHVYCKRGGFLSPISFDPSEFGIPPTSLEATDTSQLLGLMAAKAALEDAGYGENRDFSREKISVILGVTGTQELVIPLGARLGHPHWRKALEASGISPEKTEEVIQRISDSYVSWQESSFPGLLGNVIAGRIANRLDLGGTNCAVDAACASSMSAMHMALMELQTGRADMAVTGGVDCLNDIFMHMCFSKTPILSPSGDVRPFSKDADGSILGEGVGVLIFKRLEDAQKHGDRIYAVIKSMGTSSDGKSNSIYAPRAEGQIKALEIAYKDADILPESVKLIEAHGTGTRVGDEVEFSALKQVYNKQSNDKTAIGSVKSMIGHTKAAAGAAGLIKGVLALYHKILPPTLKANEPDPRLDIENSPFYLSTNTIPWIANSQYPRRCAVSSFGFGGSNFHMVLEEYEPNKSQVSWDGSVEIVSFSASTQQDLKASIEQFKADIEKGMSNQEIALRAAKTRETFSCDDPFRILLVLEKNIDQFENCQQIFSSALNKLTSDNQNNKNVFYGNLQKTGELAFVFPGQGSQYTNMGKDLACCFPEFLEILGKVNAVGQNIDKLSNFIYPYPPKNPDEKNKQEQALKNTDVAQPAIGAVSMAMFKILQRFGLKPEAACGHSFGELTALYAGSKIDEETFFNLAFTRGKLMAEASCESAGTMMAVKAPLDEIDSIIKSENLDVVLANRNSPEQGVLSGSVQAIEQAEKICRQKNISSTRLPVSAAFHSKLLKNAQKPFAQAVENININASDTLVFSNMTAEPYPDKPDEAKKLLADQILSPVDFVNEIKNLFDIGVRTFVEVGPKSVLTNLVKAILSGLNFNALSLDASSGRRFGLADLARLLCHLAALGHPVDLKQWEHPVSQTRKQRMSIPISGANYRSEQKNKKTVPKNQKNVQRSKPDIIKSPKPVSKENKMPLSDVVQKQQVLPEKQTPVSNSIQSKPDKPIVGNIKTMNKQNHNPVTPSAGLVSDAFKVVQEGLKSMQALQMQTAETHKKFLETQTQASKTLQEMMESTQRLAQTSIGSSEDFSIKDIHKNIQEQPSFKEPVVCENTSFPVQTEINQPVQEQASIRPDDTIHSEKAPDKTVAESSDFTPATNGRKKIEAAMLEVVSELTGYPTDMLSLDMDIEADLGIDSIKRVEILSAFEEKVPGLPSVSPEIMGTLKTLGHVVEHLMGAEIKKVETQPVKPDVSIPKPSSAKAVSDVTQIEKAMLEVVSELTGYPTDMLSLDMDIEADLGIDSIKRVEILSAFEEKMPNLPSVSPEVMGTLKTLGQIVEYLIESNPASDKTVNTNQQAEIKEQPKQESCPQISTNQIEKIMLEVVSDLTGYPIDMLSLDMDIEADLGIDSIKRVEILSAFEEKMPDLPSVSPEVMGTLKTLGQIVEYLTQPDNIEKNNDQQNNVSEQTSYEHQIEPVKKKIISLGTRPYELDSPVIIPENYYVYITKDKTGLGKAVADEFEKQGIKIILSLPDELLQKHDQPAAGLVIIADAWENQDDKFLKQAFDLARNFALELIEAGKQSSAIFGTIASMDGAFGFKGKGFKSAFQGGLAGLAKTASLEWDNVLCHALDIEPSWNDLSEKANAVVRTLICADDMVEIGLNPDSQTILKITDSDYPEGEINLESGDVVVVTGGARGVTAAAAKALAHKVKPVLVLLGRSPLPKPDPEWLKSLTEPGPMKKAILENEFKGQKTTPVQLEKAFKKYQANREVFNNLDSIRSSGATVLYYSADVRNLNDISAALDEVRSAYGPVKALIHGAGTLKDRFILDKTPEQFEQVFDTKVKGLEVLLQATKNDPLCYLILFSSVAARMGNKGQVDYSMANEVLNKIAQQESLKRNNCKVISFNWGPWDGGMVSPELKREFVKNNIKLIPIDAGAMSMTAEMRINQNIVKPNVEVIIGSGLPASQKSKSKMPKPLESNLSVSFKREIDLNTFPVLKSHMLDGIPVVPFALIAELMGHGALHENPGLFLVGLDDIRLLKGIRLEQDSKMISLLSGKAKRNGEIYEVDVELRNGFKSGHEMIHSKAKAILSDNPVYKAPEFTPPADIRMKSYPKTIDDVYDNILFHGFELRGLKEIMTCSPRSMVAKIAAAPPPEKWMSEPLRSQWISDPLILDCAFQMAIVWCYENKNLLSLPSYSAKYRQYCSQFPSDGVTAILEVTQSSANKIKGDFTFIDNTDKVAATLTGYEAVMDQALFKAFRH